MTWNELSQASLDNILAWAKIQPWCQAMADCQQDSGWHSEGDVWTHTQMVCTRLLQLDQWPTLAPHEQTILLFATLLHDCGKPLTSQIDPATGRITSPKHGSKGERLARSILRGLECDLNTREEIARLVRYHGRPPFLLDKPNPNHEVIALSWWVNNKLLYLLALADTRGRTTSDMERPEENLHYWKLAAEENNCFDKSYQFANDQARFLFYRQREPNLYYIPHEDYRSTVTVMSGLPGSGKDTWLAKHRLELPMVSLDDIRNDLDIKAVDNQGKVIQEAKERCREFLRLHQPFAFNATNLLFQTRQRWIDLFADYHSRIEIVYIEPLMSEILVRNKRREKSVSEKVIRELADKCEPPTWAEAHQLVVVDS